MSLCFYKVEVDVFRGSVRFLRMEVMCHFIDMFVMSYLLFSFVFVVYFEVFLSGFDSFALVVIGAYWAIWKEEFKGKIPVLSLLYLSIVVIFTAEVYAMMVVAIVVIVCNIV